MIYHILKWICYCEIYNVIILNFWIFEPEQPEGPAPAPAKKIEISRRRRRLSRNKIDLKSSGSVPAQPAPADFNFFSRRRPFRLFRLKNSKI